MTVAFRTKPGITRRSLLIAVGLAVTAAIGLTRVYLRVHWLSDVSSGWALGFSAFALAAAIALVATHFRDNPRPDERTAERNPARPCWRWELSTTSSARRAWSRWPHSSA